jgi:predicted N-acetyltransferase YhbS
MWQIERARGREFKEVTDFLDMAFGATPGLFAEGLSHIYARRDDWMAWNRVIRDDGRIVGVFGIFPMRLRVGGAVLRTTGIGGVSTHPDYRGRGIMSDFLRDACRELREDGDDISILWGHRERYARYGWETAGAQFWLSISRRAGWREEGKGVRKFNVRRDLERALDAYSRISVRVERDEEQMRARLRRGKFEFFVSDRTTPFAYAAALKSGKRRVVELAGDPAGAENILAHLSRKAEGSIEVNASAELGPIDRRVRALAEGVNCRGLGSIKIVNLASTIRKLLPAINRNLNPLSAEGAVTLKMRGTDQAVTLSLGSRVTIAKSCAGAATVSLSDRELSRLIFGHAGAGPDVALKGKAAVLGHLFPVPLFVHSLDHV